MGHEDDFPKKKRAIEWKGRRSGFSQGKILAYQVLVQKPPISLPQQGEEEGLPLLWANAPTQGSYLPLQLWVLRSCF